MKIVTIIFLIVLTWQVTAQEGTGEEKYDLNLEIAGHFVFSDYLGGFGINAVVYSPDKKFSFALRNVFLLKVEKKSTLGVYPDNFVLSKFHTLNYLDVDYCWNIDKKHKFETGLGIGWVYLGLKENVKLNTDYGYYVMSLSANYNVTWFYLQIRGDIPIFKTYNSKEQGPDRLFPVTLGIFYRFKPGGK